VDLCLRVGVGVPGALNVSAALCNDGHVEAVRALDQAGIRGPAVWVGFKDVCGRNLPAFAQHITDDLDGLRRKLAELGY